MWYLHSTSNLSYHPYTMKSLSPIRLFTSKSEETPASLPVETIEAAPGREEEESTVIKTIGWVSAGLGAIAIGLFIGRELRQRYKFNRRTPYDLYSHAGDEQDIDFGLGI